MAKQAKVARSLTLSRVAEVQLRLPMASSTSRRIRAILRRLVTLSGQAVVEIGRIVKPGLVIEKDAEGKRVTRVSLVVPAQSWDDVREARNFLDPDRPRRAQRGSGNQKGKTESEETPAESKKPSAAFLALPAHLKLNSYGLVGMEERGEDLPLLIFRLAEEYEYEEAGETKKYRWEIPPLYLQGLIQRWIPSRHRGYLPRSMQQGACQEVTQQTVSHWRLEEDASQPYTSFPSFAEREPEARRRAWREALLRLSRRVEPFQRRKRGNDTVIDEPDIKLVRAGPYPERMTARFIASGDVLIWRRSGSLKLYASLPIWRSVGEESPLLRFLEEEQVAGGVNLFWWRECLAEFTPLPAWPKAQLKADKDWLLVPISDEKGRLAKWLAQPERKLCWSVITERQVQGQPEFYLQITTQIKAQARLRPNLLAVLPTMEDDCSCLRLALVEAGQVGQSFCLAIDQIPLTPIRRERHWQKSRSQRAVRAGRLVSWLADRLDANLAIGDITWLDKRGGDATANTLASRWNYADLTKAIENKAADYCDPVAIVARISQFEREKATSEKVPQAGITTVAKLAWERWQSKKQSSKTAKVRV